MEYRVLGPVEAWAGGERVRVSKGRQETVLATLLSSAQQTASLGHLVDCVWEGAPPATATKLIRNTVSELRHVLAGRSSIVPVARGYRLDLHGGAIDSIRFDGLLRQAAAAQARDDLPRASQLLHEALALWRGEALADIPSEVLRREVVPGLAERRLTALERRIEIDLRLGRHQDLVTELRELTGKHPLREVLWAHLIVALYRCGRQAEALDTARRVRRLLADELGVGPSRQLQELHQAMLTDDPALLCQPNTPVRTTAVVPVPRQLPAAPRRFTGRTNELALLTSSTAGAPVVLTGTGGIGKTWLALHWAHAHLDRFPDGQLFVNLRGFDPTGPPASPHDAIRRILDMLGVDPAAIPVDPDAQAALYRSLTADKRMLVLLDNATDTAQVTPLLPGGSQCTVLITSRDRMSGLVTTHDAHPLPLPMLSEPDAHTVLTLRLGSDRLAREPDAVRALLASCAGLPLALSIAAGRAQEHPDFPLATLAGELRAATTRLGALDTDPATSVRTVLSSSYTALAAGPARLFGLIGLAPGVDLSLSAASGLAGGSVERTRALLRVLVDGSLVQHHAPGRYRMHDLVRLYACEQAERHLPVAERNLARRRLIDTYLHTGYAADRLLYSDRPPLHLDRAARGVHPQPPDDAPAAWAWFAAEHANLLAAQRFAVDAGWHRAVWQLAWVLDTFQHRRGHQHGLVQSWQHALAAADHLGDPVRQAIAHWRVGDAHTRAGRTADALAHLDTALRLAEDTGDRDTQARTHWAFGRLWEQRSVPRKAVAHAECAWRLYHELADPLWEGRALSVLGWNAALAGEHQQARAYCVAALELHRGQRDREGEAATLDSLGYLAQQGGRAERALAHYQQALGLRRALGNPYFEADTLDRLGKAHTALHQHDAARTSWQQALVLYTEQHRLADVQRIRHQLDALPELAA